MGRPRGTTVLYQKIAKQLSNRIRRGTWQEGLILPSYSELAKDFNTSVLTISRALKCLAQEERIVHTPNLKWMVREAKQVLNLSTNRVILVSSYELKYYWISHLDGLHLIKKGIELALNEKNRQLQIVARYWHNRKMNTKIISGLRDDGDIRGVLLHGQFTKQCQREYIASGVPVVLVDAPPVSDRLAAVCVDNEAAAHDAVQRLVYLGHRKIAFCCRGLTNTSELDPDSLERQNGFLSGLKSRGITKGEESIFNFAEGKNNSNASALQALFSVRPHFTAVLAVDSSIASIIARAAHAAGLVLPRDLSIVSFAEAGSRWSGPRTDFEQIGREAVELLESREIKQIRVPSYWHEGTTIGDPKK